MQKYQLRSETPTPDFAEGYPIGNGRLGLMCYGGPARLIFAINHADLYFRPAAKPVRQPGLWGTIRERALAGQWIEAGKLVDNAYAPWKPAENYSFQPVAFLELWLELQDGAGNYERTLDYKNAVATTRFISDRRRYTVTVSLDPELAGAYVRVETAHPRGLIGRVRLLRPADPRFKTPQSYGSENRLGLRMKFPDRLAFDARADLVGAAMVPASLKLSPESSAEAHAEGIVRTGSSLTLRVAVEIARDRKPAMGRLIARAAKTPPRPAPIADRYLHRAAIDLPGGRADDLSAPAHYQRLWELGRYLFAASCRTDGLPPNLQGIWNERVNPVCDSDWHLDLNLQMNLWHVPAGNLLEYHVTFFRLVEMMIPGARRNAKMIFGMRGLAFPATTIGYGEGTKHLDAWAGISGWLMQHYWTHWRYTLDRGFLHDRFYPLLREVGRFYLDYLVADGRRLIIIPSVSPENRMPDRGYKQYGRNSTFDLAIFREVFGHTLEAARILGQTDALVDETRSALDRLAAYPLAPDGRLCEMEDYEWPCGHRHLSHLYPLFPGSEILPENRKMFRAAGLALKRFRSFPSTGGVARFDRLGHGGWAGWTYCELACCYARLGQGDEALAMLQRYSKAFRWPGGLALCNEAFDSGFGIHASPGIGKWIQIDAALGAVAAVQEMLFQSHGGILRLLPALPRAWAQGSFRGLRAEDGFEVDAVWEKGRLREATIRSLLGRHCRLKVPVNTTWRLLADSGCKPAVEWDARRRIMSFETKRSGQYRLGPER